jgi:hypothetical protein
MITPADTHDRWAAWTAVIDEPLVLAVIVRARETWRSAEAISAESGIPLDRVRRVLDATPAGVIVARGPDRDGRALYSTRAHYRQTTGLFQRYIEALAT